MSTINIPESQIGPGGKTSAQGNIPANCTSIDATVVSSDWFTTTGTVHWELQFLVGGEWKIVGGDLVMGSTAKNNGVTLPTTGYSGPMLAQATKARIFASATPAISLGAIITFTP
jgi:hypothetical protein